MDLSGWVSLVSTRGLLMSLWLGRYITRDKMRLISERRRCLGGLYSYCAMKERSNQFMALLE